MFVVNFNNRLEILREYVLNPGVNIIEDDTLSEDDRTEHIGIGNKDLNHFKEILEFFKIKGIFINESDLNYKSLLERYTILQKQRELLKQNIKQKNNEILILINKQVKSSIKMCQHYNANIKREQLSDAQIEAIKKEYNDIKDYPYRFKVMDTIDKLFNELVNEKMQAYPLAYYAIKDDLKL
jgi:hypothetical protein